MEKGQSFANASSSFFDDEWKFFFFILFFNFPVRMYVCIMCAFLIFQSEKQICHNFVCTVWYWIGPHLMRRCLHCTRFFTFSPFTLFIFFFFGHRLLSVFGGGAQVVVWLMLINYMAAFKLKSATTTQTNLIEKLFSPRFAYKLVRHLVRPAVSQSFSQAQHAAAAGTMRYGEALGFRQTAFASPYSA